MIFDADHFDECTYDGEVGFRFYDLDTIMQITGIVPYSLTAIVQGTFIASYELEAHIIWQQRVRYFLDIIPKCDMSSGYSLEASILRGNPSKRNTGDYASYKVKVPEYDNTNS